ncbi:hypothetical protein AQUCO_00100167v1 [Aquilegia coerulea]|uniref:Protein kinase domain-containing protein n=1 Tax=Aquilegia coerulea TaxID=218851 RepID=A0A2G5F945_AQUCA|nr:hypothetical protein AQUCO_00100167v1 [Aquilegia coerulea]
MINCTEEKPCISISKMLYYVETIDYDSQTITVVGMDELAQKCPRPVNDVTQLIHETPSLHLKNQNNLSMFYNCSAYPPDQLHVACLEFNGTKRSYAYRTNTQFPDFVSNVNCERTLVVPLSNFDNATDGTLTDSNYSITLQMGFQLGWGRPDCFRCESSGGLCWVNETQTTTINVGCICGDVDGICHHESYGSLALQRYSYSDVKKMTSSFKDTLGEGGYGSVFKGKLSDGRLMAVKILKESKANGEEFINEVATIGKTNHVNVVTLLGFCSDRSKRALVYEFMSNGSLERFIYNEIKSSTTKGERLYRIALGIAKGLEYLHSGCNTRILHFDIKPHNILLDEDFCPKISDFGLAKLCPTRESVVSILAARGTIGYIAPEIYCRNFGGVSYKSDVYSYGMMVLEMIGGRKNIDATVVNTSEIYFPHWIYNRLENEIAIGGSEEIFKEETTKKMVLVGLWCIQTHPTNRPSMAKVVDMLEGNIEDLEMPPNPFTDPPPTPFIDLPSTSSPSTL